MKRGYKFKTMTCHVCGKRIAENWYLRHLKESHPKETDEMRRDGRNWEGARQ